LAIVLPIFYIWALINMTYLKNIAIAGASGVIGTPIIDQLLRGGRHNITALTRSGSKAKFPDSVKAAEVDYEDKSSLALALTDQDVLLICLSVATPIAVEKRLVGAASEARVRWIVPNEWSPDITSDPNVGKVCPHAIFRQ
jgi:saccharopine dehydrogenase-like NADP-dependent oxidoreductase